MSQLNLVPNDRTLFSQVIVDGHRHASDENGGVVEGVHARVEAVALPIVAVLDAFVEVVRGFSATLKWSSQYMSSADASSLDQAAEHFCLTLISIQRIVAGLLAAGTGLFAPGATFSHLVNRYAHKQES